MWWITKLNFRVKGHPLSNPYICRNAFYTLHWDVCSKHFGGSRAILARVFIPFYSYKNPVWVFIMSYLVLFTKVSSIVLKKNKLLTCQGRAHFETKDSIRYCILPCVNLWQSQNEIYGNQRDSKNIWKKSIGTKHLFLQVTVH